MQERQRFCQAGAVPAGSQRDAMLPEPLVTLDFRCNAWAMEGDTEWVTATVSQCGTCALSIFPSRLTSWQASHTVSSGRECGP